VRAISDLEPKLSDLELAGLPNATLSTCAVLQIMHAIGGCRPGVTRFLAAARIKAGSNAL
jgi:hypothetical protein